MRVRVAFDPAASNRTQLLSSELRIRVRLAQSGHIDLEPGTAPGTNAGPGRRATDRTADRCRAPVSRPGWPGCSFSDPSLGTGLALVTRRSHHHGDSDVH